jgi:Response regulator containing CheY-like receiver, AAA-type ATPase, and DNA-binding domains
MNKILIIEDDDDKLSTLMDFIETEFPLLRVDTAKSFSSGLRLLIKGSDKYAGVLLDMSMPNYDSTATEPGGGKPESYAGSDLLAQMKLRKINIPTIIVTMFDKHGEEPNRISLEQLTQQLNNQYSPIFRGLTYYSLSEGGWRTSLMTQIKKEIIGND